MTKDSIWNTARDQGMEHTLTREESRRVQKGQTREQIVYDRFWRLRPDGIAVRLTTETETGVFCILEYKHMSDVTDQYLLRARLKTQNQHESLRRDLRNTIHLQGWSFEDHF
jgi:hypothetical protein